MNQNQNNRENELEFEIEDLSIDDAKVDININPSVQVITGSSSGEKIEMQEDDILDDTNNSKKDTSLKQDEDSEGLSNNINNSNHEYENQNPEEKEGSQEEKKSLRQKVQDVKENLKEKSDQIKNAPENLKNKYNDVKDKVNSAKEKVRKAPENLKNKKDAVKDKWNNRPKSMKEAKKRAQNSFKNAGKNIKNRAKQGAKNFANNAKEGAKEGFKNSDLGQSIQKAKNAIDKGKKVANGTKKAGKAVAKAGKVTAKVAAKVTKGLVDFIIATAPVSLIIIGVVLLVAFVIIVAIALSPGKHNINDSVNSKDYSEVDIKTLEKLRDLYQKYPNADAALAMVTVIYPYYESLQSGNVTYYMNIENLDSSEIYEDISDEEYEDAEEVEDEETCSNDECETNVGDDMYLELFRKWSYRRKFKKLLKKSNSMSNEEFEEYLKNDYFKSEVGYKTLFGLVDDQKKDDFADAIIDDLNDTKNYFMNYIYDSISCSSTLVDSGAVSTPDIISSGVVIDLKKPGCSSMKSCSDSYYDEYLSLEEYVKGVVYEEIAGTTDVGILGAQMVAAKSFALSRRKALLDPNTGLYVIEMLWSTADQDFCHVEKGCNSSDINAHYGYNTNGDTRLFHGTNREPASEELKALLNQAWENTKDVYMLNKAGNVASTAYYAGSGCKVGTCMRQDLMLTMKNQTYDSILSSFYTQFNIGTVVGNDTNIKVPSELVCSNTTTNLTSTRNKIVSFASNYAEKIPYVENAVASVSGYDGNNFGIVTNEDGSEDKTGLGVIGFVNWVYWSVVDENFGNTNSFDSILNNTYEITQDNLLLGDIGYSSDKTLVAIYLGDNKWAFEDSITGNVVVQPSDKFTMFARLNKFENEKYNYIIRNHKPNADEWGGSKMPVKPNSPSLMGECPWYAKNRAAEMIIELYKNGSLSEDKYNKYYNRVKSTRGNGSGFYSNGPADNGYTGSNNIEDLKAGAFIGLKSTNTPAGMKYGHVMVVESVNENEIVLTDGWRLKSPNTYCRSYNDFSCVVFRQKVFKSFEEYRDYVNGSHGYTFLGYLYFLED